MSQERSSQINLLLLGMDHKQPKLMAWEYMNQQLFSLVVVVVVAIAGDNEPAVRLFSSAIHSFDSTHHK